MATSCAARVALFSWRFVVPLVVFVVCYWKIISSLRRRAKVALTRRRVQQPAAAGPSTSTATSKPPSKAQRNVVKTMIVIISSFIVCWLPLQFTFVTQYCGLRTPSYKTLYYVYSIMAGVNFCVNPFIYATGMYPFLREKCVAGLRRLVRRERQLVSPVELKHVGTANPSKRDASFHV